MSTNAHPTRCGYVTARGRNCQHTDLTRSRSADDTARSRNSSIPDLTLQHSSSVDRPGNLNGGNSAWRRWGQIAASPRQAGVGRATDCAAPLDETRRVRAAGRRSPPPRRSGSTPGVRKAGPQPKSERVPRICQSRAPSDRRPVHRGDRQPKPLFLAKRVRAIRYAGAIRCPASFREQGSPRRAQTSFARNPRQSKTLATGLSAGWRRPTATIALLA